ncbi:helix-turn-helix domain-containing protein [Pseudomonas sp. KCJK9016]|uniref:AraC family transcriptional regulator n=1 Tax=Pseudomonas sp. KCJK9016 TaxID=3344556 RepID=UPI003905DB1F
MVSQIKSCIDFEWRPLQNYLTDRGVELPELSLFTVNNEPRLPSEILYSWIVSNAVAPEAGLQLGRYYNISDYGVAGLMLYSSENAVEAYNVISENIKLFNSDIVDLRMSCDAQNQMRFAVALKLCSGWTAAQQQFHVNVVASASHKILHELFGGFFKLSGLTIPRIFSNGFDYSSFFGFPVRLRGSDVVFHFSKRQLECSIPTANPAVLQSTLALMREELNKHLRDGSRGIKEQVIKLLESLHGAYPDIQTVAHQLKITERTLRRRLAIENCSFRQILDEVRYARAKQLLQTQQPISKISEELGYSDVSSFRYAFKRWAGKNVTDFRSSLAMCSSGRRRI